MQPGGHRFDPGQLHQKIVGQDNSRRGDGMEWIASLGPFLIPIVALIIGGAIAITSMVLRHQERIAKIERGIDPDAPQR